MKQEKIDKLMNEIDKKCKLPKHWEEFITNNSKNHHLIIKDSKEKKLYCTNCNKYFIDKTVKVRDYIECPHCHTKSRVYGINYYTKCFEQPVVLVQRMNKKVIIRIFEIYSYFNEDDKKIKRHYIEYARIIPGVGRFLGNNVSINMFGVINVCHNYEKLDWHTYKGHKFLTDYPTYPYNKKRLIKGTIMEYAPIDKFMNYCSYYYYNFLDVLELAAYGSFELLWNMKLYNLCFYSKALNKKGSFQKRFGVPKSFLKFMQDNNVTYKELMLLQLFQKDDKNLIQNYRNTNIHYLRFLNKNNVLDDFLKSGIELNYINMNLIKNISKYIPIKKLMKYQKGLKHLNIYKDYLDMAKELSYNYKSKKDLYPRNLIARHDKMQAKIKATEDMNTQFKAYIRYLELSKYTYSDDNYIIFPAPSIDSMKDEGKQQKNCVGHMYLDSYINGKTEIFFIRNLKNVNKSLITLEFRNGHIVQKELAHHDRNFTDEQKNFMDKWLGFRNFIVQKEKVKNKAKIEVVQYNLNKKIA